jgi:hypothetical protein
MKKIICYGSFTISRKGCSDKSGFGSRILQKEQLTILVLTTDSDGKAGAAFAYKLSTADDKYYDSEKPTAPGEYTVRATVPETDTYNGFVCTGSLYHKRKREKRSS